LAVSILFPKYWWILKFGEIDQPKKWKEKVMKTQRHNNFISNFMIIKTLKEFWFNLSKKSSYIFCINSFPKFESFEINGWFYAHKIILVDL
jgi:hypothetical protein